MRVSGDFTRTLTVVSTINDNFAIPQVVEKAAIARVWGTPLWESEAIFYFQNVAS